MVPLIKFHENHVISDDASDRLGRPARLPKTPIGADLVVLFPHHDDRFSEQGDHQGIAAVGKGGDEIDEVPPRPVGRGHLSPEDPVVRLDGHAPGWADAESQLISPARVLHAVDPLDAVSQLISLACTIRDVDPLGVLSQLISPLTASAPKASAAEKAVANTAQRILLDIVGFVLT